MYHLVKGEKERRFGFFFSLFPKVNIFYGPNPVLSLFQKEAEHSLSLSFQIKMEMPSLTAGLFAQIPLSNKPK